MNGGIFLLLGSNLGNRKGNLQLALDELQDAGTIIKRSGIYSTAPWGNTDQPAFLNQVIEMHYDGTAEQLLETVLSIEERIGRIRQERWGPRIIDIDILLFRSEVHRNRLLTIPHPELPNRRFALVPLHEIASEVMHPLLHQSMQELLQSCPDESLVEPLGNA